jgi:voltage-dependent calcium channel alpha-2/delta-3
MNAKAEWFDATKLLEEMRTDLQNMLKWKKEAVDRIATEAEKLSKNHTHVKNLVFPYKNAKRLYDPRYEATKPNASVMELSYHPNFGDVKVNTYESVVHVPVNVWEQGSEIMNSIAWSDGLTPVFRNNLAYDPNLNWQFFGSNEGFLRLFPAAKWRLPYLGFKAVPTSSIHAMHVKEGSEVMGLDLYDARMRNWFIQGASSPKDMIILLDGSGSMTGQRREIAKHVVLNILETLTDDDYVSVIRFAEDLKPIVSCFGENLVPASRQNIREFRDQMEGMNTSDIANFSLALSSAFEKMNNMHEYNQGSMCNQVIMLVTDGAPETYQAIFEKYNWPRIPVRVFTYLVGREVTETREVNWMACHNRGYYTHVANLAEVREQVQLYIPVMARPLVLAGPEKRPFVWTPVYADVQEILMSNWLWDERQKDKIRQAIRAQVLLEKGNKTDSSAEVTSNTHGGIGHEETETPVEENEEEDDYDQEIESEVNNTQSRSRRHLRSSDTLYDVMSSGTTEEDNNNQGKRSARNFNLKAASSVEVNDVLESLSPSSSFDQRMAQPLMLFSREEEMRKRRRSAKVRQYSFF